MRRNAYLAGLLSLVVPGLGQMYAGRGGRGAAIMAGAIVIASFNLLFVLGFAAVNLQQSSGWAYWVPRLGHDVVALWSTIYWLWAVVDAHHLARRQVAG